MNELAPEVAQKLKKDKDGLFAAIAQQYDTKEVLMLAWVDETALARTLAERKAVYWSRSRQEYWRKGDTSGHFQNVHDVQLDCDGDAILLLVDQMGAACHTGTRTCFHSVMASGGTALPTNQPV
jgi:phosphoribosyl-AMP cyclohydrolase